MLLRKSLLVSGILASLLYVAMNVFIPLQWPAYSQFYHTVSELSAVDAPTRPVWVPWAIVYTLLMAAFGTGVLIVAGHKKQLRIIGILLLVYGLTGIFWPPMHQREVLAAGGATITDTMHLVFAGATVLLMVLQIVFAMLSLGKAFRIYSIISLIALMTFGVLTSSGAPKVEANLPTPWLGVWERINIGIYLLWIMVLAIILLPAGPGKAEK